MSAIATFYKEDRSLGMVLLNEAVFAGDSLLAVRIRGISVFNFRIRSAGFFTMILSPKTSIWAPKRRILRLGEIFLSGCKLKPRSVASSSMAWNVDNAVDSGSAPKPSSTK